MFTQLSRVDVRPNIKVVINQTRTVDSLDFGLEMSSMGLRKDLPDSGSAETLASIEGATTILKPNRPARLSTIQQEPSDWDYSSGPDSPRFSSSSPRRSSSIATRPRDSVGLNTTEEESKAM
jgi:hypothetical protein